MNPIQGRLAVGPRRVPGGSDGQRRQLLDRIRGEYDEMPDLKLTVWQACRLWNLTTAQCDEMFDALVSERFLQRTKDGAYLRPGGARISEAELN